MSRLLIVLMALGLCGCGTAGFLAMTALGIASQIPGSPGQPKRLTMEQVCDPARDKRDDIPAFVALCPSGP